MCVCVCACACVFPSWIAASQQNEIYSCVNLMEVKYFGLLATHSLDFLNSLETYILASSGAQFRLLIQHVIKLVTV